MSNYAAPARRRFIFAPFGRKTAALLLTIVVLTAAGTSAWGYWSSLGGGSGTAATGTLNAPTHVVASSTQGSGDVGVSWSAPTGPTAPEGYLVRRTGTGNSLTTFACGTDMTHLVNALTCTDGAVADGTYTYVVTAVFRSWTAPSGSSDPVTVVNDATPPTTSITRSPVGGDATWSASDVQVTLAATDAATGVKAIHYTVNGGAEQVVSGSSTSFTVSREDSNALVFWAVDNAGNAEAPHNTASVKVDKTAPVTSLSLTSTSTPSSGYYAADVSVSLTGTDVSPNPGAASSGIAGMKYQLNGTTGSWTSYAAPFRLSTDGTTTIYYASTDLAGNTETVKSQVVKIDRTAPSTSASLGGTVGSIGWYTSSVQVTLSTLADTSGVTKTEYSLTGMAPWTTYTAPFSINAEGSTTVTFRSTDAAGNVESNKTQLIKIDLTAPATSVALSGIPGSNGWYTSNVQVTLSPAADTSGVAKTEYSLTGGATWTTYNAPFSLTSEGSTTVTYRSTDGAGNVEPNQTQSVKIDKTAPGKPSIASISNDTGVSSSDGITKTTDQAVSGTAEANSAVNLYRGSVVIGTTIANSSGSWTVSGVTLQTGTNSLTVVATDAAGNTSVTSDVFTALLDNVAPTGAFSAPALSGSTMTSNAYKNECTQNFAVCGTASDAGGAALITPSATVVRTNGQAPTLTYSGTPASWAFGTGNLQNGTYTFTVTFLDRAGNAAQIVTVITIS